MRVGFAGTRISPPGRLRRSIAAGFDVPLVLTRPDRPEGAGSGSNRRRSSALPQSARHLPVLQPATLKSAEAGARAIAGRRARRAGGRRLRPDPAARRPCLAAPRLPQHPCVEAAAMARRGADPARDQAGDAVTGITIMQMDAGLDTGPVIECVDVDDRSARDRRHAARQAGGSGARADRRRTRASRARRRAASGDAAACDRRDLRRQDRAARMRRSTGRIVRGRHRPRNSCVRSGARAPQRSSAAQAVKVWRARADRATSHAARRRVPSRRTRRRHRRRLRRRRACGFATCSPPAASGCPRRAFAAGRGVAPGALLRARRAQN